MKTFQESKSQMKFQTTIAAAFHFHPKKTSLRVTVVAKFSRHRIIAVYVIPWATNNKYF